MKEKLQQKNMYALLTSCWFLHRARLPLSITHQKIQHTLINFCRWWQTLLKWYSLWFENYVCMAFFIVCEYLVRSSHSLQTLHTNGVLRTMHFNVCACSKVFNLYFFFLIIGWIIQISRGGYIAPQILPGRRLNERFVTAYLKLIYQTSPENFMPKLLAPTWKQNLYTLMTACNILHEHP